MDFNSINVQNYDKMTFGNCLRQQRMELGYSLKKLSNLLGITPAYLNDIEKGNRYAPLNSKKNILELLVKALSIPDDQLDAFYNMAIMTCGHLAFKDYLEKEKNALLFVHQASQIDLTEEDWNKLFFQLGRIKQEKENQISRKLEVKKKICEINK